MPVRDCMTGSPFCTDHDYEEFRDPVLSQHTQTIERKDSKRSWIPKHSSERQKGEHNGKLWKFADKMHDVKEKTRHHM